MYEEKSLLLVNLDVFERVRFDEIWAGKPANLIEQCRGNDFVIRESLIGYTPPPPPHREMFRLKK